LLGGGVVGDDSLQPAVIPPMATISAVARAARMPSDDNKTTPAPTSADRRGREPG